MGSVSSPSNNRTILGFKVGVQADLNTLLSQGTSANAAHGTFYLAGDTHRLYIGNSDGSISAVNEGVVTVANLAALENITANAGEFYYVTASNVLAVWNGTDWVQINPDTYRKLDSVSQTMSDSSGVTTITTSITDKNNKNADAQTKSDAIKVTGAGGAKVASDSTGTDPVLTITGEQYQIGSSVAQDNDKATISLSGSSGFSDTPGSVTLQAGNSNVSFTQGTSSGTGNTNITITTKDTINHLTDLSVANAASNGNGFVFSATVDDSRGSTFNSTDTATFDPQIKHSSSDANPVHFVNGVATLDVYKKSEIDDLMTGLDAMHYMGTIGTNGTINKTVITSSTETTKFKIGDTYKLCTTVEVDGTEYPTNTIAIANGTEGSDGYITSATLHFDIIQATVNENTTHYFDGTSSTGKAGVTLKDSTTSHAASGTIEIQQGTATTVTNNWDSTTKTQTITVGHADVTSTPSTAEAWAQSVASDTAAGSAATATSTKNIITGVTVNAQGHVTAVETTPMTFKDTNIKPTSLANTVAADANTANKVNVTNTLNYNNGLGTAKTVSNSTAPLSIASDNLTVTADGNNGVKINFVWGSF